MTYAFTAPGAAIEGGSDVPPAYSPPPGGHVSTGDKKKNQYPPPPGPPPGKKHNIYAPPPGPPPGHPGRLSNPNNFPPGTLSGHAPAHASYPPGPSGSHQGPAYLHQKGGFLGLDPKPSHLGTTTKILSIVLPPVGSWRAERGQGELGGISFCANVGFTLLFYPLGMAYGWMRVAHLRKKLGHPKAYRSH